MRETRIKQLARRPLAEDAGPPVKEREKVYISPELHVEPLPTMYLRRALSYRFVRQVLEETFGAENIAQLHRLTANGPVAMDLADELTQMERLFAGAYVVACREIGLAESLPADLGGKAGADESAKTFLRWTASLRSDEDLAPDCRMMAPVFFDLEREKTKAWVMLGWSHADAGIGYVREPGIKIIGPGGKPATGTDAPEIIFQWSWRQLATPIFAEVYVTKILDRAEFRRHCDAYQTTAAILANLE